MRCPFCTSLEDKVIDYVAEQAKVSEKEVTKAELEKEIEKLDDEA